MTETSVPDPAVDRTGYVLAVARLRERRTDAAMQGVWWRPEHSDQVLAVAGEMATEIPVLLAIHGGDAEHAAAEANPAHVRAGVALWRWVATELQHHDWCPSADPCRCVRGLVLDRVVSECQAYMRDTPVAAEETTGAVEPLAFDWHREQSIDPDVLLVWLLPTALRRPDMERLSELTKKFTDCRLTMRLNGVDLDAAAFLDSITRNLQHAARREAARLVAEAGFADVEDAVAQATAAVRETLVERLRAAGVQIRDNDV